MGFYWKLFVQLKKIASVIRYWMFFVQDARGY